MRPCRHGGSDRGPRTDDRGTAAAPRPAGAHPFRLHGRGRPPRPVAHVQESAPHRPRAGTGVRAVPGRGLFHGHPTPGQRVELAHGGPRGRDRDRLDRQLVRGLRAERRHRRPATGSDRQIARQPDVDPDRRPARDVHAAVIPRRTPALTAVEVVRTDPRGEHGDRVPDDPAGAGEVRRRGRLVRGLPQPARRGGAPPGALGRDRQHRHAPDRGHRFALGPGAPVPALHGRRTASAAVVGDDRLVRGDPLHHRPADLVRGLVGREPADVDDDPAERLRLLVRLDPDRDRRLRAALPPLRHRRRDQPRAAVRNDRRRHHRRVRRRSWSGSAPSSGSKGEPILSAAAAAIIAIAFQPLRTRAQRFADRLVYGERAAPYEVLSEFSERLGNTYANDQLLPRMAAALAGGTGAVRADVWVRIGDQLVPEATWPHDADSASADRRRRERRRRRVAVADARADPASGRAPGCPVDRETAR